MPKFFTNPMKPALGVSDFGKLIQFRSSTGERATYFDKTLMILDITNDPTQFLLFTRPRRFGKTLNMSMLEYFFGKKESKKLFDGLKISEYPHIIETFQGKVPTIFLSLKDVCGVNFNETLEKFHIKLRDTVDNYNSLIEITKFSWIYTKEYTIPKLQNFIYELSKELYSVTQKSVLIILDEYDAPLNTAYAENYLSEALKFFRAFFSQTFKDNPYLYKGVITGINRIARENLFSELNNFVVCDIDYTEYSNYFGFTQEEIDSINIPEEYKLTIKEYYNGYNFGGITIYNPWSVLNYLKNNYKADTYWSNSGGMTMLENNLSIDLVLPLEKLLNGEKIPIEIEDGLIYYDLKHNSNTFWNLLYNAGYLTSASDWYETKFKDLKLVNKEVLEYMKLLYIRWFTNKQGYTFLRELIEAFIQGDELGLQVWLQTSVLQSLSFHDVTVRNQEAFYHGFLMGLSFGAKGIYEIKSNHESGYGRYDIAWYPKDPTKDHGILIELKVDSTSAEEALQQIDTKKYESDLLQYGCTKIMAYGIHCDGKKVRVVMRK